LTEFFTELKLEKEEVIEISSDEEQSGSDI
jgi:hypothetical protein